MIWRLLRSLRVQLVLLIIIALGIAQFVSLWLFADERSLAIRAALGFEAAGRAANVARLIEEAPADLRPSIIRAANSPLVRFDLGTKPLVQHSDHSDGGLVETRVRALLNDSYSRDIRVELHQIQGAILPLPNLSHEMTEMHLAMMRGELSAIEMNLSISIAGGQWLNVSTRFERPPIQWPLYSMLTFGLTAMALLVAVSWFVMTGLLGPLRRLAWASERLGRGEDIDALPERGPQEVRELTAGFNRMQDRLTRFVADRTRVLAALGHDLRSPLTAMRVHSEMVEEDETRESLVATVEEMQSMVEATLTFAKGLSGNEPMQDVDLQSFLEALRGDMVVPFVLSDGPEVTVRLRPNAIRRALRNVIENAVRYGGSATLGWISAEGEIEISVTDRGPGIPTAELERIFDPFFRLEESRSLETGGHGLGLSIARSILRAQGGEISLANHPDGGLIATIRLPVAET
ncbi:MULTISPECIES: ATP-binding protein [Roseobacteraceae]|jgi:signal transduction histidine kinase|uniref:histidine kinase n=3 Tax=Celeribacter TaxID=875170 RepID=K2J0J6_9RHOB|nr:MULTISPECIES: ATP-binding protein [Roseobacteraceae]EKE68588.1 integral membrane sensor signal transduction histidine kinase [Celeribacter baekdonensis B30]MDF1803487.1 ATP-binding protein [Thalassovita sp.]PTQ66425.1 signal transduction histidine kinase [Celeribacter persicus]SDG12831.1 His Kinase A (phospho-acceptor) domain-containing protein [Celeribacter baekdonensis]|tara:strand:+ start:5857 stop:7242 length:1386 start_codon:yes stop_codon:yes gene_type:complete